MDLPLIFHRFPTDPPAEGPPGQRRADAAAALVAPGGAVPGKAAGRWLGGAAFVGGLLTLLEYCCFSNGFKIFQWFLEYVHVYWNKPHIVTNGWFNGKLYNVFDGVNITIFGLSIIGGLMSTLDF